MQLSSCGYYTLTYDYIFDDLIKKRKRAILYESARENFLCKHCNIRYKSLGVEGYIEVTKVRECRIVEDLDFWRGRRVWVAFDLSLSGDNTAVAMVTEGGKGDIIEERGNPYHDEKGRFASADGSSLKSVDKSSESGIIYGEPVIAGVGAKSSTYPVVYYPETDVQVEFVIGSRPKYPPDHTMAGYNCKTHRQIDDIDRLVDEYNCDAQYWQKEKARYEVYDEYGEIREVELHWYQHPDIGKVEYKVKTKGGYVYVDEWL